jgi:hypothetical protein
MAGSLALAQRWWMRMSCAAAATAAAAAQRARPDHRLDVFGVLPVPKVVRGEEHCGEERDGRWSRAEVASVRWHGDDGEEDASFIVVV